MALLPALAISALLVLALGLPRLLVVCTGPHCEARIEWVHRSAADCCAHDREHVGGRAAHADAHDHAGAGHVDADCDGDDGGEQPALHCGHGHCQDQTLPLDEGPLPRAVAFATPAPAVAALAPFVPDATRAIQRPLSRPPATGPPRRDRRTALLATTILRR